jgi:sugar-specific transcriptional regulator TrmB
MFKEIKEDLQKQLNESQDNIDKKKTWEDTETTTWTQRGFQQTNEIKEIIWKKK